MSERDSKYTNLDSTLKAVGKAVFVNFYYDFKNTAISKEDLAEKLFQENPLSQSKKQGFRIPRARHIFAQDWHLDALEKVISSKRVNIQVRNSAKKILDKERASLLFENEHTDEVAFIKKINKLVTESEDTYFEYNNSRQKPKDGYKSPHYEYRRNKSIAINALRKAKHLCEVDPNHFIFRRKNSSINYTEPHHLIPLFAQKYFPDTNLDREQNIISLCSNCHNRLHYGEEIDEILTFLYESRKDILASIGIATSYEQIKSFYK